MGTSLSVRGLRSREVVVVCEVLVPEELGLGLSSVVGFAVGFTGVTRSGEAGLSF